MSLRGVYRRIGMPHEEIDGVPIWYEERGDLAGPPLVALHGGILTFQRSFGDVLPWLTEGRRVIGVELQGHGHTPDTGRAMSIERFADDVAELIDRVAGGGPVDVWGYSLGALTATSLAVRHPGKVRRLVLAASNIRTDGYHPEITAPEQDDPRLPTEGEFATWKADYESVAPDPAGLLPFSSACSRSCTTSPAGPLRRSVRSPSHVPRGRRPRLCPPRPRRRDARSLS